MIWNLVPDIAISLIVVAIVLEFALRNETKRPLSKDSLNKRRWDDPNNKDKLDTTVPCSFVGSGIMFGHERFYLISKDPADQSKLFAG